MKKASCIKNIETRFQLDFLNDLILVDDKQVYFLFDISKKPTMFYLLSGNIGKLGLPQIDEFEANMLLNYVEPDNLLADVEGKHNFIENIIKKFRNFKDELFLYIPIKNPNTPLWLYISLRRIENKPLILGQVVRIYHETPSNIIHYQKTYQDSLTRLFSRETLKMHMDYLKNTENSYFIYLDIDNFKVINDKYGHQAGDQFLIEIANFFISKWEYNVLYYRLGGDEFAIYCYDHSKEDILNRAKQLIHDIENLNETAKALDISMSIGIVKITEETKAYHTLLNLGDKAMYQSKEKGKGHYTLYNE